MDILNELYDELLREEFLEEFNLDAILSEAGEGEEAPKENNVDNKVGAGDKIKQAAKGAADTAKGVAKGVADGAKDVAKGAKDAAVNAKDAATDALDFFINKFEGMANNVDGFIANVLNKGTDQVNKIKTALKSNSSYSAFEGFTLAANEFLQIPSMAIRNVQNAEMICGQLDHWFGGMMNGFKKQGKNLKNKSIFGLNTAKKAKGQGDNTKDGILKNLLGACNTLLQGIGGAVSEIGKVFSSMWQTIKGSANKKESFRINEALLEEEVDFLLS